MSLCYDSTPIIFKIIGYMKQFHSYTPKILLNSYFNE